MAQQPLSKLTPEQLERARDLGAASFLSAYVRLMTEKLEVKSTPEECNAMALEMVPVLNLAAEGAWRAMMHDTDGVDDVLGRLRIVLEAL